jgi:hypothetical protein
MKVQDAIEYTFDLSNLIERILSLREGESLCATDRIYLVNILESVKDLILKSDVSSCLQFEHPEE